MIFSQSLAKFGYFWSVYEIFALPCHKATGFCSSLPRLTNGVRLGKINPALFFETRQLPCFTELYTLFYGTGKKQIPVLLLYLFNPIVLAPPPRPLWEGAEDNG